MTRQRQLLWAVAGFLATLLLCGGAGVAAMRLLARAPAPAYTPDVAGYLTQAVKTSQALQTAASPAASAPAVVTPTPSLASPTPPASPTARPTPTPRCLAAGFVQDVTVPDGTEMAPGTTFTKTWRLINRGTCTWTAGFALAFAGGEQMGAPDRVPLPKVVPPGDMVDVSVTMQAPATPGEYQGFWKLRSDKGTEFGVGDDAAQPVWVLIRVVATPTPTPTATPGVTSTATGAPPSATPTAAGPTATPAPPTATATPAPPTSTPTPAPPTPTPTPAPPTNTPTPAPPTSTPTPAPPTPTPTPP